MKNGNNDETYVVILPVEGKAFMNTFNKKDSYKQLSNAVKGYIELAPLPTIPSSGKYEIDCWVNEEGLLKGMHCNRELTAYAGGTYLVGDAIFAGHDGEGETVGLDRADAERIMNMFN